MSTGNAKLKRRWTKFSLRMFLAFVAVIAVGCGWFAFKLNQARQQRQIVAAILNAGGGIGYDYQTRLVPGHPDYFSVEDHALPSQPAWLRNLLGDDFFRDVFVVSFYNLDRKIPESVLAQLTKLPKLRFVYMTNMKITSNGSDIQRRLQDADIVVLEQLSNLRFLNIEGAKFTPEGIRQLRQKLPNTVFSQ